MFSIISFATLWPFKSSSYLEFSFKPFEILLFYLLLLHLLVLVSYLVFVINGLTYGIFDIFCFTMGD